MFFWDLLWNAVLMTGFIILFGAFLAYCIGQSVVLMEDEDE